VGASIVVAVGVSQYSIFDRYRRFYFIWNLHAQSYCIWLINHILQTNTKKNKNIYYRYEIALLFDNEVLYSRVKMYTSKSNSYRRTLATFRLHEGQANRSRNCSLEFVVSHEKTPYNSNTVSCRSIISHILVLIMLCLLRISVRLLSQLFRVGHPSSRLIPNPISCINKTYTGPLHIILNHT